MFGWNLAIDRGDAEIARITTEHEQTVARLVDDRADDIERCGQNTETLKVIYSERIDSLQLEVNQLRGVLLQNLLEDTVAGIGF